MFSFSLDKEEKKGQLKVVFHNPDGYALYYSKAYYDSNSKNFLYLVPSQEGQTGEVCDEFNYIFSNKCIAGSTFRKTFFVYPFKRNLQTGEKEFLPKNHLYFEVGQIDARYKNYIEKSDASDEPFIEPTLDPGNVVGGYGFIVGWNTVSFTYRL